MYYSKWTKKKKSNKLKKPLLNVLISQMLSASSVHKEFHRLLSLCLYDKEILKEAKKVALIYKKDSLNYNPIIKITTRDISTPERDNSTLASLMFMKDS